MWTAILRNVDLRRLRYIFGAFSLLEHNLDISSAIYAKSAVSRCASTPPATLQDTRSRAITVRTQLAGGRDSLLHPPSTRDRRSTMHSIPAMRTPQRAEHQRTHTVTTCTGDDPSVLVERYQLGTISGSPRSPVRRLWTCTGRTSQRDGHMFENAQQASEPGSASSGSAIASQSSLWPSRWQTRPSVGASPRLSPRVTRP